MSDHINGQIQLSTPKTKASIRKLVLPPAVVAVLKNYKETVHSRWMFPSPVKDDCCTALKPAFFNAATCRLAGLLHIPSVINILRHFTSDMWQ